MKFGSQERVCLNFVCDVVYLAGSRIPSLYAFSDQSNRNVEADVIHNQGAGTKMVDLELKIFNSRTHFLSS